MNHITRRNRLKAQRKMYWDYLKLCDENEGKKLMREIQRIDIQIEAINNMRLNEIQEQVITYEITKPSKINEDTTPIKQRHAYSL